MKRVQTVCGEISTDQLGFTLMHEHLVSSQAGIAENYPQLYVENAYDRVMKDLLEMKAHGIQTVVEATPFDLGRDAPMLQRLSSDSGVQVIACTGFFQELAGMLGFYTKEQYAQLFIDDLTKGIAGTDIKAGIIKTAMDVEGPTPGREIIHRAVAIASRETGFPVMLHSDPRGEMGRHQIRFLREEGANLERVKIDHCLETTDMDYLSWLYDQGVWLGVDRLPLIAAEGTRAVPTEQRIETVRKMIEAGMSDRMLFAHDFMSISTYFDHMASQEEQAYIRSLNPQRFLFLQEVVFPKLEEAGIDGKLLQKMCVDNPRRFFES